ncbi:hypothetical protein ACQPXH_24950 [Nocardia sp. CA-135953]|uniref:hypothetical protein n=1 Tax=Nocardia sp. CA-135953 TaxID=3239978 RepID=UPI003D99FD0A
MRLSISLADFTWPDSPGAIGPRVDRIVRAADQSGFVDEDFEQITELVRAVADL